MRSFTVETMTNCSITLYQKDKKFFRKKYEYNWARMMVAMKEQVEGVDSVRWVAGQYAKKKYSQVNCILDPGQYYIIITVDWI